MCHFISPTVEEPDEVESDDEDDEEDEVRQYPQSANVLCKAKSFCLHFTSKQILPFGFAE